MSENRDIVQAETDVLSVPAYELDVDAALDHAQRMVSLRKRLVPIIASLTYPSDWNKFGDRARIEEGGACRLLDPLKIRITDIQGPERERKEDEQGEYYVYRYTCNAESRFGARLEGVIGTCTTRDKFFARVKSPDGETILRPLSEIDQTNIEKKAYANMVVNAVSLIAGIKGLPWHVLKQAGIDESQVAEVEFKGATGERKKKVQKKTGGKAVQDLIELCMSRAEGDKQVASELLYEWSKFTTDDGEEKGCRSFKNISEKWAGSTLRKAREDRAFQDEFSTWSDE